MAKFHFTREMMRGPIYRKYEKAISNVWNPRELDFGQDAVMVWELRDAKAIRLSLYPTLEQAISAIEQESSA